MTRIIGLDYGAKRIGVALTDPTRTIASPLLTLQRRIGKRPPWPEIRRIVEENEVTEAVVGLPLSLAGEESEWTEEVRAFGAEIERRFAIPVHFVDERLSSVAAEEVVRGLGLRKRKREEKHRIDSTAAALILRAHLDESNRSRGSEDDAGA
jgi:putative holliday junction resolvase